MSDRRARCLICRIVCTRLRARYVLPVTLRACTSRRVLERYSSRARRMCVFTPKLTVYDPSVSVMSVYSRYSARYFVTLITCARSALPRDGITQRNVVDFACKRKDYFARS